MYYIFDRDPKRVSFISSHKKLIIITKQEEKKKDRWSLLELLLGSKDMAESLLPFFLPLCCFFPFLTL